MRPAVMCSAALMCFFSLLLGTAVFFIVQCQVEKPEDVLGSHVKHPKSIAVDSSAGRMFVVDHVDELILSLDLEGGDVNELGLQLQQPHSVAVDVAAQKLYWTDLAAGNVQRSSYDGRDVEDVAVGLDRPAGIAVVSAGWGGSSAPYVRVIWASHGQVKIQTVNVHPTLPVVPPSITDVSSYGAADDIFGVAADENYVYWTQPMSGTILRAPFNGGRPAHVLAEHLERPEDIAVSVADGSVYWSEPDAGRIGRTSINIGLTSRNPNVEFVVVTSEEPRGLACDEDGHLYFGDSSAQVVRRTGVDGECTLYRVLEDEMIALVVLVCALVFAVLGCCVVFCLFARSRRLAKSSPPVSEMKPTDNNADDTTKQDAEDTTKDAEDHERVTTADDQDGAEGSGTAGSGNGPEDVEEGHDTEPALLLSMKPSLEPLEEKDQDVERRPEPELEIRDNSGKCCVFCVA